jgi:hypothetical protein
MIMFLGSAFEKVNLPILKQVPDLIYGVHIYNVTIVDKYPYTIKSFKLIYTDYIKLFNYPTFNTWKKLTLNVLVSLVLVCIVWTLSKLWYKYCGCYVWSFCGRKCQEISKIS